MKDRPEGGRFGSGIVSSYTYVLTLFAGAGIVYLAKKDLGPEGTRILSSAWGIDSNGWIWFWIIAGMMLAITVPKAAVMESYRRHTGFAYVEDRIGFSKAGGEDISFWSGFLTFVAVLGLFAFLLPGGALGMAQPFVIVIAICVLGSILARSIARAVFSAQFGSPYPT